MQIAVDVLASGRKHGTITGLAERHNVSRQTIYDIANKGKDVLYKGLEPGPHGPCVGGAVVEVDRNRLGRSVVMLSEAGVSQRDVRFCLDEMLDTKPSLGWVNGRLAEAEIAATEANERMKPSVGETLSGDEIFSNGSPNLLVVGNDSLFIYELSRQPERDGDTWGCVLMDAPSCPQFSSDGGSGLAAGADVAGVEVHQLDWDHLLRPMWGQVARLERRAYSAIEKVDERAGKFNRANSPKRLENHLAAWERLNREADAKIREYDEFFRIARQVDEEFGLIDPQTGQLRDAVAGAARLKELGQKLKVYEGVIYTRLSTYLVGMAEALFRYQAALKEALAPLVERWGAPAIRALSRLWQLEADARRRPLSPAEQNRAQLGWTQALDEAVALLGEERLWEAWDALSRVLNRSWRGSMLAECINSLLRPFLNGRKQTDQGFLELFRFLHNTRPFKRGKRAGRSPAQLVGLDVQDDPLVLLGFAPKKCKSNFSGF